MITETIIINDYKEKIKNKYVVQKRYRYQGGNQISLTEYIPRTQWPIENNTLQQKPKIWKHKRIKTSNTLCIQVHLSYNKWHVNITFGDVTHVTIEEREPRKMHINVTFLQSLLLCVSLLNMVLLYSYTRKKNLANVGSKYL